jgi:hypothetical protein
MCCAWLIDGFWIGWLDLLASWCTQFSEIQAINSANPDLHTLQFTVKHALCFTVFTRRILATDSWQSHCHFKSHMKSSSHRLNPFLPLFCNCQFWRLDSVQFLCSPSSYPGKLASRNSTQFFSTELFFITTLHEPRRKHSHSIAGKACLQRRCIITEVTRLLLAYSLPREWFYRVVA